MCGFFHFCDIVVSFSLNMKKLRLGLKGIYITKEASSFTWSLLLLYETICHLQFLAMTLHWLYSVLVMLSCNRLFGRPTSRFKHGPICRDLTASRNNPTLGANTWSRSTGCSETVIEGLKPMSQIWSWGQSSKLISIIYQNQAKNFPHSVR